MKGMESHEPPLSAATELSTRKRVLWETAEHQAPEIDRLNARNSYFHAEDIRYLRFLIPPGLRVLELGCGTGNLLAALDPVEGIGIDFSPAMIRIAERRHPQLEFQLGDIEDPSVIDGLAGRTFDVILLCDTIGSLDDVQRSFVLLHRLCRPETRIIVVYHSRLWEPILRAAEALGLKTPTPKQNWLSAADIGVFLALCDFQQIKREWRMLLPKRLLGLGPFVNRFVATLPLLRRLCVRNYLVFRSMRSASSERPSASIIIPCRNERGNIENAVRRLPVFVPEQEIIFIEGHSLDGTLEEIRRVIAAYPQLDIKVAVQDRKGKGDAVRKGFDMARGDILMILDADLTMPPEDMPKFYEVLASGKGEFVNGSRLVYPLEKQAMRFLNLLANRAFAVLFSYMLNQRFTDTLCGTKALSRANYRKLTEARSYFGDFDPFGDFDLIFGAAKLNLTSVEIPVRYFPRRYGTTQISRFRHGWLLLRMVVFAWWKLKAI
jgi:SAM-dependent methyltransferase